MQLGDLEWKVEPTGENAKSANQPLASLVKLDHVDDVCDDDECDGGDVDSWNDFDFDRVDGKNDDACYVFPL